MNSDNKGMMMTTDTTRRMLILASWLAVGPAVAVQSPPAAAAVDPLDRFTPLAAEELSRLRAGLWVGTLKLDFAVRLETTLQRAEETFALRTTLRLNDQGDGFHSVHTEVASAPGGGAALTSTAVPNGIEVQLGPDTTRIVHAITEKGVEAVIANTMDGVSIDNDLNLDITLPQFSGVTQTFLSRSRVSHIARDVGLYGLLRP